MIVAVPVLALIQVASSAVFSAAGAPGSLPSRLSPATGARIYAGLVAVVPLPSFETMLAQYALDIGDAAGAQGAAGKLPDSAMRDELLGRAARMRGDRRAALEYFLAAPDVNAVGRDVDRQARRNPLAAAALETRLLDRLAALTVHPDAVAEAHWRLGQLLTRASYLPSTPKHPIALDRSRLLLAMRHYRRAVALAPLNVKYLLGAASGALLLGEVARARAYYQRGVDADPTNVAAARGLAKLRGKTT